MNKHFKQVLLKSTQAKDIIDISSIQSLWSGYGEILRCELDSAMHSSVIVKHVHFPTKNGEKNCFVQLTVSLRL